MTQAITFRNTVRAFGILGILAFLWMANKAHSAPLKLEPEPAQTSFLDHVTVSPFGAYTFADLTGEATLSAGLDLGLAVNKFVSIHATAAARETDDWGGSAIDESELYGRAAFVRFAKETVVFYGKGGVVRDWGASLWGFGVGAGLELRLAEHVSLAGDYTIRAYFDEREKDGQVRALVNIRF
jgi:hypothetical protein